MQRTNALSHHSGLTSEVFPSSELELELLTRKRKHSIKMLQPMGKINKWKRKENFFVLGKKKSATDPNGVKKSRAN